MWNDAIFPCVSAPLGSNYGGVEDTDFWLRSSSANVEFEKFFQIGNVSSNPSLATQIPIALHSNTAFENEISRANIVTPNLGLGPSEESMLEELVLTGKRKRAKSCTNSSKIPKAWPESSTGPHCPRHSKSAQEQKPSKQTLAKRNQKLGDKITALQQLVSPFGKTDTASVLQETSICIKFLHEQIQMLTAPYISSNSSTSNQTVNGDLRSKSLCLLPVSSSIVNLINQGVSLHSYKPNGSNKGCSMRFY